MKYPDTEQYKFSKSDKHSNKPTTK